MVTEELPIADEIEESFQSTLATMLTTFMKLPGSAVACAILDYLDEFGRTKDADELRSILRQFCAGSKNGTLNPDYGWRLALGEIEALFWFDLHGIGGSLSQSFSALGKVNTFGPGVTMGVSGPAVGASFIGTHYMASGNYPQTNR